MPPWLSSPTQRYRAALVTAMLVLVLVLLWSAWTALLPFFLGTILAYLLLPAVNFFDDHAPGFMRRRGISRPLSIILVYILVLSLISGLLSSFIPAIVRQASMLSEVGPELLTSMQDIITYDVVNWLENVHPAIRDALNLQQAGQTLLEGAQKGLRVTLRTLSQTVSFVLGMIVVPIWLFYVLNDQDEGRRAFYNLIPDKARADVRCIATIVDDLLSAYVRGQLLLCVVVGVMATVALLIIGVDLALLLGTFAGILEVIPVLGPILSAVPAILVALLDKPMNALWVALAFIVIQQLENNILVPRISASTVHFHPAVVMVVVVVGSEIAGLWGVLLGVPVAAIIRDVYKYLYLRTTERGATPKMALDNLRAGVI